MMTLERFRTLADSYGADLQRWPEQLRPQARALLESSTQAREIIALAGELDEAIAVAGRAHREALWAGDHPEAALARLRNSVAARIGARGAAGTTTRAAHHGPRRMRWISLATAAVVAIVGGVLLGIRYPPLGSQQDLLALLQPVPIQLPDD